MRTATATYHAPEGDSKTVEMGGAQFMDGEPTEINSVDHPHLMTKIEGNKHFEVDMGKDDGASVGAPKTRNFSAGIEEARDHDFERDRRDALDKRPVAELRQIAEERGIDHEGLSKAELREALSS